MVLLVPAEDVDHLVGARRQGSESLVRGATQVDVLREERGRCKVLVLPGGFAVYTLCFIRYHVIYNI